MWGDGGHSRRAIKASASQIVQSVRNELAEILRLFRRRQCFSHAASLTFTTLFAAVPFTAVIYAVLSAAPGFEEVGGLLRGFVFENFVPESAGRVEELLVEFSDQARNLTFVGIILLIASTVILLMSVEHAFNHVWGVTEARRGLILLVGYWGVITLGPLLVGFGFVASSYLASLPLLAEAGVEPLRLTFVEFLPELSGFMAFSLLYYAVPNCRVPPLHALAGGLLATLLFELAKELFATAMGIGNLHVIYGAFAVVPLFLVWVYLVWSIILGVAIVIARFSPDEQRSGNAPPLLLKCLRTLELVALTHPKGSLGRELARQADMSRTEWTEVLDELLRRQLLKQKGQYLVLGNALASLPLKELYTRFPHGLSLSAISNYPGNPDLVSPLISFLEQGEVILSQPVRLSPSGDKSSGP